MLLFGGGDYLNKIQSVRPQNLVSLWPQNEPAGGISTEIVRQYNGAYTGVTLGQPGVPGSGLTSAGYDGVTSFNNIYTAGFANDNRLLNPGFETPGAMPPTFANWVDTVSVGAIDSEAVIVHEGAASAKLTAGVVTDTSIRQQNVYVPGERGRIRFWARGDGVNAGRYRLYDDTNGAYIIPWGTSTGITAAAWGMVAVEFTVPAGCVLASLWLDCTPVNGGIAYFDACEVRRMDGFLGDQGTVIVPAQVANVGVWTDGANRYAVALRVDDNNYIWLYKSTVNNRFTFQYNAGGVLSRQDTAALANVDFATYGMTWDKSAGATGEVMYYIDGVASGATDVGLGTWVGNLVNTVTVIGASSTVPANIWSGNIGPVPVWSAALSPDEMRYLG